MKFTGAWYDPERSGEGLSITEYDDGTVIAYFYSYHPDGAQLWIEGNGKRVGNQAVLSGAEPRGGKLHDTAALKNVVEHPWGGITLTEQAGNRILVTFPTAWYVVQPLYAGSNTCSSANASTGTYTRTRT